ncbi:hypothetical protein [Leptospira meyeri]|nr:hypothetical protein [Leptospira meyeri]
MQTIRNNKYLNIIFIIILFLSIYYIIQILLLYRETFGTELSAIHEHWSEFGGFISGTIGTFLSFITVLLLIITIYLQIEELRATREELKFASEQIAQNRLESERNNILFEKQIEQAEMLAFERKKTDSVLNVLQSLNIDIENLLKKPIPYLVYNPNTKNTVDYRNLMTGPLLSEYLHYPDLSIKHIKETVAYEYVQEQLLIAMENLNALVEQWNDYSRLIPDEPETGTRLYYSNRFEWITDNVKILRESVLKLK